MMTNHQKLILRAIELASQCRPIASAQPTFTSPGGRAAQRRSSAVASRPRGDDLANRRPPSGAGFAPGLARPGVRPPARVGEALGPAAVRPCGSVAREGVS